MIVMIIGFHPEDEKDLVSANRVVDLDEVALDTRVEDPDSGVAALIARSATDLRRASSLAGLFPQAKHLVIAVARDPQNRSLAFPVLSPDWPTLRSLQARRGSAGEWVVEARFNRQMAMGEFVASMARGLSGHRIEAPSFPRVALAGPGAAHWRPRDLGAGLIAEAGPLDEPDGYAPADLVLRSTGPESSSWPDPRVAFVDRPQLDRLSWARLGRKGGLDEALSLLPSLSDVDAVPPVDERSVNPSGFVSNPEQGTGVLTQVGGGWCVRRGDDEIVRFHPSGLVTDADVGRLRQLRLLNIEWGRHSGPIAAARVIVGLAAAGVPLRAARVPLWARSIGGPLIGLITDADETEFADDLRREEHSIRLRRAALRTHSTEARWRSLAEKARLKVPERSTVSVVLCTRRPDFVDAALRQIARQQGIDLEIVLTLHGVPAELPEVNAAITACAKPVTVVEVPADVSFGEALNRGIARASGRYVAKWDDDDWYGPDFLADMVLAASYSGAELVGCFAQFVYLEQIGLTIYRRAGQSERMGRMVAGGTFVMESAFLNTVGGFPPVRRSVDAAMLKTTAAVGGRIYRTHGLGYLLNRRAVGHTWGAPVTYFLRSAERQWRGFRPGPLMEQEAAESAMDGM